MSMEIIKKYFPNLTEKQIEQFSALYNLYLDWNSKINVISRKDIENLYEHHVLHSLAIAKVLTFRDTTSIMDVGTGGGFPAIPLAILYPNCNFHLVDSIGKKIKVAQSVSDSIGLSNTSFQHARVEEVKSSFDFIVSRAVMPLEDLVRLTRKNVDIKKQKNSLPNGLICLKGGELEQEILPFKKNASLFDLSDFFEEEFFLTKKVVYVSY